MKPNIIIVMADQQRADLRKSNGCPLDTMPFLDKWSENGVDFTKGYSPNPICLPARISMFTGRYGESHKARTNCNGEDAFYSEDILDVLKKNGYITALCGKNHTHRKISDFDFYETNDHFKLSAEHEQNEQDKEFTEFLHEKAAINSFEASPHGIEVQFPYKNVSSALKFIDELDGEKPFFAWVSFAEPHGPYQVPEPYFDMFKTDELPECVSFEETVKANKGYRFEFNRKSFEHFMPDDINETILRCRSNYFGMLRLIDDQFKRLIEGLESRNLSDNTLVVYLSDHGDFMGEYGLIRKGVDLSNILTNIPMIWGGYGVTKQGKQNKSFVNLVDVLPTICDMIGTDSPIGVQGKSIVPLLNDDDTYQKEFETAYMECGFSGLYWTEKDNWTYEQDGATAAKAKYNCLNSWTQSGQMRSLCYKDYRIQVDMMGNSYLYNLKEDKFELNNLWNNEEYSSLKAEMLTKLMMATMQNTDVFPTPHGRMHLKTHPKGYWYQDYNII